MGVASLRMGQWVARSAMQGGSSRGVRSQARRPARNGEGRGGSDVVELKRALAVDRVLCF